MPQGLRELAVPSRNRTIGPVRAPSELEGCVLGHLWKHGPCTAYSVRSAMLESPSSQWSGSAGAIYPLLQRFEERGLVRSRKAMRGERESWLYTLTAGGRGRFREWLGPPLTPDVVSITADPLRTRMYFLGALSTRERSAFIASARATLRRHLEELETSSAREVFDRLALRGAIRMTHARLAWLDEVRRVIARGMSAKR